MNESGIYGIMKMILRFLMTIVFGVAGYQIAQYTLTFEISWLRHTSFPHAWTIFSVIFFASCGFLATHIIWWVLKKTGKLFENMLQNVTVPDIVVAITGLMLSLLLATLVAIPFWFIDIPGVGFYISFAVYILFAGIGVTAFLKRRDDVWATITNIFGRGARLGSKRGKDDQSSNLLVGDFLYQVPQEQTAGKKVLDTSALIDGRILDIANTGFLEGILILPRFVLTELQGVADSSDPARRARGRKGLNVVSELQKIRTMVVNIVDISMKDLKRDKVDEALVELCKRLDAKILTTDYNLNQIARIDGIRVLNVNDLANSLKPQFLPGDMVKIDVIRPGKETGQGIGYLEDGTMLVVEDGESAIGTTSDIVITSMLQTSAGRMVFGKLKR